MARACTDSKHPAPETKDHFTSVHHHLSFFLHSVVTGPGYYHSVYFSATNLLIILIVFFLYTNAQSVHFRELC